MVDAGGPGRLAEGIRPLFIDQVRRAFVDEPGRAALNVPPDPGEISNMYDAVVRALPSAFISPASDALLHAVVRALEHRPDFELTELFDALDRRGPGLETKTYLELLIDWARRAVPTGGPRTAALMGAVRLRRGRPISFDGLGAVHWFARNLLQLPAEGQLNVMGFLGMSGLAAEGAITMLAASVLNEGAAPALALVGADFTPGPWKPGKMPVPYYIGHRAHEAIGEFYLIVHPPPKHAVFLNRIPISSIAADLSRRFRFTPGSLPRAELRSMPDIFDFPINDPPPKVYEIKPWSLLALAEREARGYADSIAKAWIPAVLGPTTEPGTSGVVPAPGGAYVFQSVAPGTIVYRWVPISEEATASEASEAVLKAAVASGLSVLSIMVLWELLKALGILVLV